MRFATHLLAPCLLVGLWPAPVGATVTVSFVEPERYSDAGRDYGSERRAAVLGDIRSHLEHLGARYLKPDRLLKVEVLDIDLAGRYEPWRALSYDVRTMREVTWPRIELRYALEDNGTVLLRAQETLTDLNYLMRPAARLSNDPRRYEKAMLTSWFRARFVQARPPRG